MNLHILFCPAQSVAPDGSPLPTAALALTLNDETQYRCAGFVQAEIERYAEELSESGHTDQEDNEIDSEQDQSEDDEQAKPKRKEKLKGKRRVQTGGSGTFQHVCTLPSLTKRYIILLDDNARSHLEKEYLFMGVIATFLRAIRAGAIHFRHSATLLAHYGRLGPSFDLCSKLIIDILREEGMYKGHGEGVVAVITLALCEVSHAILYQLQANAHGTP